MQPLEERLEELGGGEFLEVVDDEYDDDDHIHHHHLGHNDDNHMDIAGSRVGSGYNVDAIIYLNDGEGRFEIAQIGSEISGKGRPYGFGDFDNDKKIEYVTFTAESNASYTKQKINFHLFEIDKQIGTGPSFQNGQFRGFHGRKAV